MLLGDPLESFAEMQRSSLEQTGTAPQPTAKDLSSFHVHNLEKGGEATSQSQFLRGNAWDVWSLHIVAPVPRTEAARDPATPGAVKCPTEAKNQADVRILPNPS